MTYTKDGITYTYEKRNVGMGDIVVDLNKDIIREADWQDYDEIGNVITGQVSAIETVLVVNLAGTDGEIVINSINVKDIKSYTKDMHINDFAIIKGTVLKSFTQKKLPK